MTFPNQLAILDRALALSRVGGDAELLQEMAQLFLDEYPSQIEAIRDAVRQRDPKAVERAAHCLKGSVGNFGADAAAKAAFGLELMGRAGNLEGVDNALAALENALRELEPVMSNLAIDATAD